MTLPFVPDGLHCTAGTSNATELSVVHGPCSMVPHTRQHGNLLMCIPESWLRASGVGHNRYPGMYINRSISLIRATWEGTEELGAAGEAQARAIWEEQFGQRCRMGAKR